MRQVCGLEKESKYWNASTFFLQYLLCQHILQTYLLLSASSLLKWKNLWALAVPSLLNYRIIVGVLKIVRYCRIVLRITVSITKMQPGQWEKFVVATMLPHIGICLPNSNFIHTRFYYLNNIKGVIYSWGNSMSIIFSQ